MLNGHLYKFLCERCVKVFFTTSEKYSSLYYGVIEILDILQIQFFCQIYALLLHPSCIFPPYLSTDFLTKPQKCFLRKWQAQSKTYMEIQRTQNRPNKFGKDNQSWCLHYLISRLTKSYSNQNDTALAWWTNQQYKTESRKRLTLNMVTLFLTKALKQSKRERKVFPTNGAGTTWDPYKGGGKGGIDLQTPTPHNIHRNEVRGESQTYMKS